MPTGDRSATSASDDEPPEHPDIPLAIEHGNVESDLTWSGRSMARGWARLGKPSTTFGHESESPDVFISCAGNLSGGNAAVDRSLCDVSPRFED